MKTTLQFKLTVSFIIVVVICGAVATWVGIHLIGDRIIAQAQHKVRMDLNSAREIYQQNLRKITCAVRLISERFFLKEGLLGEDGSLLKEELRRKREVEGLDVLTVTDEQGRVLFRAANPEVSGDSQADDPIVAEVLAEKEVVSSTVIVPREGLLKEGEDFAQRARMTLIPTPKAKPKSETEETSGMMLKAAAPIFDYEGNLLGVLYGGTLLNRNYELVDRIKETVYRGEVYKGKDIGTATIFQGDLRISTNVGRKDGSRAIGTRVSEEVYDQVLVKDLPWIERAFVVNEWYMTAYEPIKDIKNEIVGILYVGMLEKKFVDLRLKTIYVFLGITFAGMVIAFVVSYFLASNILKPIRNLVFASRQLGTGNLEYKVNIGSEDEIGELGETFNRMADDLKERDERLRERHEQQIMRSERLATIGRLAAGVAHELNNPLGGVLVYSHLLLEDSAPDDPKRENLQKIVKEATRCKDIVKGLLDFSRETELKVEPADLSEIIEGVLSLMEKQALFHNIGITKSLSSSLPKVMADKGQIQQVFTNIILNAAEAMDGKGDLAIRTDVSQDKKFIEVEIADTGCGIPEENVRKIFDPFFTTKETGKGTGLGLAIVYGMVKKHRGNINVKSEVGKGTTLIVRLPVKQNVANVPNEVRG